MNAVFDPGLQPERTALAWRRTALAIGVGSLLLLRLLPSALGDSRWVLAGIAGLAATVLLWTASRRRGRTVDHALAHHGDHARLPGAALLLLLAALVSATGASAAVVVLAVALTGPLT